MIKGMQAYSTVTVNERAFEKVDLNEVMEEVQSDLELAIIQKETQINYTNLPKVSGMPLLIRQLFIKKIVHRHGVEIWAEGREGAGACFHILLPL